MSILKTYNNESSDEKELLSSIRSGKEGREKAIRGLFEDMKLVNGVKKVIRSVGGDSSDFDDVFNLALVQFLKNVMTKKDLVLENVHSYIFGITRNLMFQKYRKRTKEELVGDLPEPKEQEVEVDLFIMNEERNELLKQVLAKLGVNCKEVLMHWASGISMREIAEKLGYASEGVVRKKKFHCLKEVRTLVGNNANLQRDLSL